MTELKPFWLYYGAKWRAAPLYPAPRYDTIVEPFAGAAGYSLRHFQKKVILVEKFARVAALWRYLIRSTAADIENIPLLKDGQTVDDLDACPEARDLVGFWCNEGGAMPKKTPGKWSNLDRSRARAAAQAGMIRHWTVIEGDYSQAPDVEATWYVDPPYQNAGKYYACSSKDLNFSALGSWCRRRRGQAVVCENEGADWLPFRRLDGRFQTARMNAAGKDTPEVVWLSDEQAPHHVDVWATIARCGAVGAP